MTEIQNIADLRCITARNGNADLYYLLLPAMVTISPDAIGKWSLRFGVDMALVSITDWDNDLSPWPAQNVPATEPPFAGHSPEFLKTLAGTVLPAVEKGKAYSRTLCGDSMSGMFALWAWMQTDLFRNIGSQSGSFWYPGFIGWLRHNAISKAGKAYFALGSKEGAPGNPQEFRQIQAQTREVVSLLEAKGIGCTFQTVPGNHYSDLEPRLVKMFQWLTGRT